MSGWLEQTLGALLIILILNSTCSSQFYTLENAFLPGGAPSTPEPLSGKTIERWRDRYIAAVRSLHQPRIKTFPDECVGAEHCVTLRSH
jgi:hypothetical protein